VLQIGIADIRGQRERVCRVRAAKDKDGRRDPRVTTQRALRNHRRAICRSGNRPAAEELWETSGVKAQGSGAPCAGAAAPAS